MEQLLLLQSLFEKERRRRNRRRRKLKLVHLNFQWVQYRRWKGLNNSEALFCSNYVHQFKLIKWRYWMRPSQSLFSLSESPTAKPQGGVESSTVNSSRRKGWSPWPIWYKALEDLKEPPDIAYFETFFRCGNRTTLPSSCCPEKSH